MVLCFALTPAVCGRTGICQVQTATEASINFWGEIKKMRQLNCVRPAIETGNGNEFIF